MGIQSNVLKYDWHILWLIKKENKIKIIFRFYLYKNAQEIYSLSFIETAMLWQDIKFKCTKVSESTLLISKANELYHFLIFLRSICAVIKIQKYDGRAFEMPPVFG